MTHAQHDVELQICTEHGCAGPLLVRQENSSGNGDALQGRLDLYYVVLIIMSVLNVFYFLIVAHFYKYKQVRVQSL